MSLGNRTEIPDKRADHLADCCGDPDVTVIARMPAVFQIAGAHNGRTLDQAEPYVPRHHQLAYCLFGRNTQLGES
jgi:hypothetical protein